MNAHLFLRRVLQTIPTLFLITVVSFVLLHVAPGGPAQIMLGDRSTPALVHQINHSLGLDKPLYQQYAIWLWQYLHGNFGYSYDYHQSVISLIGQNLPHTLILVITAIAFSHVLAIIVGSAQAYWRNSIGDHLTTAAIYFLYAMPTFWLGLVLVSIFAIRFGWLPSGGFSDTLSTTPSFGSILTHLVLPGLTLLLVTVAGWSRYMRASMSRVLVEDYIRTARSKGAAEWRVVGKHALKNAILPLITLGGFSIPALFSGALIIEVIFNYPGMGLLFWNAANQRDYPVLLGIIVIVGLLTVLGNLLADLLYGWADPRIKVQSG
ncbi:MAG: ABC transporter permease [Candidatus Dormibacteraceae bacterium]